MLRVVGFVKCAFFVKLGGLTMKISALNLQKKKKVSTITYYYAPQYSVCFAEV